MEDRLPQESDRQYLAYCCYRDLGLSRSLLEAQIVYGDLTGNNKTIDGKKREARRRSIGGALYKWAKDFYWEERARVWDAQAEQRRREALVQVDLDKFVADVEAIRETIATLGGETLATATILLRTAKGQSELIEEEACANEISLNKNGIEKIAALARTCKDIVAMIEGGKSIIFDAYAITELAASLSEKRSTGNSAK